MGEKTKNLTDFLTNKKLKEAQKKANQERTSANSRRKLDNVIEKKFKTTMIGSLSRFEERFGELWGHGKAPSDLTEEERVWREIWDVTRTEVLNNGNNQLRAIKEESAHYDVEYNGYQLKLPVKSITITADNKEKSDER